MRTFHEYLDRWWLWFFRSGLTSRLKMHHKVFILTCQTPKSDNQIQWDAKSINGWAQRLNEMDAVIHITGYRLEHWPWTQRQKRDSLTPAPCLDLCWLRPSKNLHPARAFSFRHRDIHDYVRPKRLFDLGFQFQFGTLDAELKDLLT